MVVVKSRVRVAQDYMCETWLDNHFLTKVSTIIDSSV